MALKLTTSDFELRQATCEVRYPEAFLIFDKTGNIFHYLSAKFKNVHTDTSTPTQTQMTFDEGTVVIELQALRLVDNDPDSNLEKFAANYKLLFDCATESLDLKLFSRVGLRLIFVKPYPTAQEAEAALNSVQLLRTGTEKRFGTGPNIAELVVRWEDKEMGAIFRFKAQDGNVLAKFPPELGLTEKSRSKEFHHLILDVDYYTVALVERGQWDPMTWITQSGRIVRKEADKMLSI